MPLFSNLAVKLPYILAQIVASTSRYLIRPKSTLPTTFLNCYSLALVKPYYLPLRVRHPQLSYHRALYPATGIFLRLLLLLFDHFLLFRPFVQVIPNTRNTVVCLIVSASQHYLSVIL